jgi:PelA/Pel-15E family pectate lyase
MSTSTQRLILFVLYILTSISSAGEEPSTDAAKAALRKAGEFFRTKVASHGGYLWRYSEDLAHREGEGETDADTIWVQPPGTPAVGLAFLAAFEATSDKFYLEAAVDAANALVKGQLRSGGWTDRVYFGAEARKKVAYRVEPEGKRQFNVSTFDDDKTQSALRLLMRVDKALEFKDSKIHEAVEYALNSILKAQFPNGAWAQGYDVPPEAEKFPVKKAQFPEDWRELPRIKNYWEYYTLNDNTMADTVAMLLDAWKIYGDEKYKKSAERAGEFLILAQLPEPQPAWAQQYDVEMRPSWARKFEPPAVSGSESQGVLETLMLLYRETGNAKFLEPIPAALAWMERSKLPDGRLARFYELKTNKPLYFTKTYEVTYSDEDMPTHYGFKVSSKAESLTKEYERVKAQPPEKLAKNLGKPKMSDKLAADAKEIIAALDEQGRWLDTRSMKYVKAPVKRTIECETFVRNVETLAKFLRAKSE